MHLKISLIICLVLINWAYTIGEETCGKNETYDPCGPFCVAHCVFRQFTSCKPGCNPGCFCKDGYIRRTRDGPCILYSDCRFLFQ
ncbi:hypothetical protein GWI33_020679 [Rhynchophorus ferrugineus]|uniref:TIL domain-containing protein n=1 Tax=Rhynchophorus ferrugineus TaxID=354439 RepID=A0A834HR49_RHYFE|nr:hypothetical protein GWI33_020679 [Rhynchophorus ferrugineus]